jgi:hypothetical protein
MDDRNLPSDRTRLIEVLQLLFTGYLTFIGLLALVIYGGQLLVMKRSVDLTKSALEGTQAAIVNLDIGHLHDDYWSLSANNDGKVGALNLNISFEVTRVNLNDGKALDIIIRDSFSRAEVMPGYDHRIEHGFQTVGQDEFAGEIIDAKQAFRIRGAAKYNNGFDHLVEEDFCLETLPNPNPHNLPVATWVPCDGVPATLDNYRRLRGKNQGAGPK